MLRTHALGLQPRTIGIASVIASIVLTAVIFLNVVKF